MIDKQRGNEMYDELKVVLAQFALKHNLNLGRVNMRGDGATIKVNTEFGDKAETGDLHPLLYSELKKHGWKWNLDVSDIGKKITYNGKQYEIMGMKNKVKVIVLELPNKRRCWISGEMIQYLAKS